MQPALRKGPAWLYTSVHLFGWVADADNAYDKPITIGDTLMLRPLPYLDSPFFMFLSRINRPSWLLAAMEGRAVYELGAYYLTYPFLQSTPEGDGHPIIILPGFMTSDLSTAPLRAYLKSRNYEAYGWDQGRNLGRDLDPENGLKSHSELFSHFDRIREIHGRKVSLIGWSLGGILARELAHQRPDDVRMVITLGSPFNGRNPHATNVEGLFELMSGYKVDDFSQSLIERAGMPPPVPSTAIYSKTDGIAAWECCIEDDHDTTENIGVLSSHFGLGHNPFVLWIIANRLAQREGKWKPFKRDGLTSFLFGKPEEPSFIW